ncbi:MAG: hypothetical protein COX48_00105 [bacterium (Candidatus Stahlbacteria) CG23_combo_of_CG06-09_8_20_14_all_34_7]|nr:MAG: hypothetical protein COX48_00105 [bacterium (Candidatus Stahlbacteria) CG23_combo_of_CG06-09_8_20_14_all_34_7]
MTEKKRIEIEKIISDGRGIGRNEGIIYFVKRSAPFDILIVNENKIKKNYIECTINSFEKESPLRIIPKCRYYNLCGGCDLQHIKFDYHREIKTRILRDLLLKNARIDYKKRIEYIFKEEFKYRNKITLSIENKRVGLLREKTNSLVEIDECILCFDEINAVLNDLKEKFDYDNKINKVVIKNSRLGKTLISFYTDYLKTDEIPSFIKNINSDNINIVLKDKSTVFIKGKGVLTDIIDGRIFSYSHSTFMQVNSGVFDEMAIYLKEHIMKGKTFIDLYSGVGLYSILFSDYFKEIVSVESNKLSVYFQRRNLQQNKIKNVNVVQKYINEKMILDDYYFQCCLINPPREGVHPIVMKNIFDSISKEIIYISCNAATLGRDLKIMTGSGFEIKDICIFDMFPNTIHFETVVILQKNL